MMQINLESRDKHSITAYSEQDVTLNGQRYQHSLIISKDHIIEHWPVHCIEDLTEDTLQMLINFNPKVIIIGQVNPKLALPPIVFAHLSGKGVGIEYMGIGSAVRTFNVLLSENREVVLGLIF